MKKIIGVFLVTVMAFSLVACGKDTNGGNADSSVTEQDATTGEDATQTENTNDTQTNYGAGVSLTDVKNALVETLGENYWPNTEIPADFLKDIYGISEDMYEEYYAEMPMISTNVDTVIIVKAKEDQITAVEDALKAYREVMVNDTMQYPMNVGKIQASRIETFGPYVCFVQLGADTMEASETGDDAVIEQCQEANELALEVIQNTLAQNQ